MSEPHPQHCMHHTPCGGLAALDGQSPDDPRAAAASDIVRALDAAMRQPADQAGACSLTTSRRARMLRISIMLARIVCSAAEARYSSYIVQ